MANLLYRATLNPPIPGSTTLKGSSLTNSEIDGNFKSLNDGLGTLDIIKIDETDAVSTNDVGKVVRRDASGNFTAGVITVTDLNSTSDRELKENINTINDPMSVLNQIDGVGFTWKHSGEQSYGVIAQELEKILPELVHEVDGYKMVSYIPLMSFLIQAIKQQQIQIDELRNR